MLLAGSIACIMMYLNGYKLKDMLLVLMLVLIVFLFIGMVVKAILDSTHLPSEDAVDPDGEVIEKSEEEGAELEEGSEAGTVSPASENAQSEGQAQT